MKKVFLIFGVMIIGLLLTGCGTKKNKTSEENKTNPGDLKEAKVSLEEYNQLKENMTLDEVTNIIGGVCTLKLKTEMDPGVKLVYSCKCDTEHPANVELTFINDKLNKKVEHGLTTEENKES